MKNLVALVLVCGLMALTSASAQTAEGVWIAEVKTFDFDGDLQQAHLWLSLRRSSQGRSSYDQFGLTLELDEVEGLHVGPGHIGESPVQFALNREAGSVMFQGRFKNEAGAGDFTFEAAWSNSARWDTATWSRGSCSSWRCTT